MIDAPRGVILGAAVLATLAALLFARPHATPGPPMRDFEAYYAAGATVNAGRDPYGMSIWRIERGLSGVLAGRNEVLPFVGPPPLLPAWSAMARLPFERASVVWRCLLIAFACALAWLAARICKAGMGAQILCAYAVFALGFGPLTSALALGQVALPAYFFAGLCLLWLPAGIFAWAQPNVAFVLIEGLFERGGALFFCSGIAAFIVASLVIVGPSGVMHYVGVVRAHQAAEQFSVIQITPAAVAYGFGLSAALALRIGTATALAAGVLWLLAMMRRADRMSRFCTTCALLPLAMPFFHEHDLVILFLPAAYVAQRCGVKTWPMAAVAALACATDWLGLAQRPDGALQTLLLVGAAGAALFVLREDVSWDAVLAPAGVVAVIAIVGALARVHPAPVWPDAMAPVMLHGDIAWMWRAEQAASGLFARNATWAALRGLSLLSCALLAYASVVSCRSTAHSRSPSPGPA